MHGHRLTVVVLLSVVLACSREHGGSGSAARQNSSSEPITASASPVPSSSPVNSTKLPPRVGLDGRAFPALVAPLGPGPRVYARSLRTWIFEEPRPDARRLGYLTRGASLPTSKASAGNRGCAGGWHQVPPQGYVCLDDDATLNHSDPLVIGTEEYPPDETRRLPYIYGIVRRPGKIYRRPPTREQLLVEEPGIEARMQRWLSLPGESGASYGQEVWTPGLGAPIDPAEAWKTKRTENLPRYVRSLLDQPEPSAELVDSIMEPRVGYSFLTTFLFQGRRYGLTRDLLLVPTDRLRPIRGSDFHGFRIPEDIDFPFALVRQPGAHLWRYDQSSKRLSKATDAPYRTALKLTGKQAFYRGRLHYETTDGLWLSDRDGSRLDPAKRMPAWGTNGEKWIDVNLTKQALVLYDGTRAVYATLVSTGEAGLDDPEKSTATKRGIFRIHTKHITATMDSDEVGEEFELRDVPYVQYFAEGYALHGAYWHDRFGIPKSHGCINLAPEDARRIFYFTEPRVPAGWHGALSPLKGTIVFVHP